MSVEQFRAFYATRPDKERWELLDGVVVRLERPTLGHQHIAANLRHLLEDAFEDHAPTLAALPWIGITIGPSVDNHDPSPDIVVIDCSLIERQGACYADRFYLAAEIVSPEDRDRVEIKRGVYKQHDACKYVLRVREDSIDVRVELRTDTGWKDQVLTKPDDLLTLPAFGLSCRVSDLYRGTPLLPRPASKR